MQRNVFGEFIVGYEDIAEELLKLNTKIYKIVPKIGTKTSFYLTHNGEVVENPNYSGFYGILNSIKCQYTGYGFKKNINDRLGSFFSEVKNDTLRKNTYHSAAKKFKSFGGRYDDLYAIIMQYPISSKTEAKEIENHLICKMKPALNKKLWLTNV